MNPGTLLCVFCDNHAINGGVTCLRHHRKESEARNILNRIAQDAGIDTDEVSEEVRKEKERLAIEDLKFEPNDRYYE